MSVLYDGYMDFCYIWYHEQVPWVVDVFKLEFGAVANLHYPMLSDSPEAQIQFSNEGPGNEGSKGP